MTRAFVSDLGPVAGERQGGTLVHPLHAGDAVTASTIITVGYLLETEALDVDELDRAVMRVVHKWPLLQGRLAWSPELGRWTLVVSPPSFPSLPTHTLTVSTHPSPISPPLSSLPSSSTAFLPIRNLPLFRHSSSSSSNSEYAARSCPLITLHVTQLSDCAAVGLSFPHGVFDGVAMGCVLSALRAELAGEPWGFTPEPPSAVNALDEAERRAFCASSSGGGSAGRADKEGGDDDAVAAARGRAQMRDFVPATALAFAWMLWTFVRERVWGRAEMRVLWLGGDVVQRLVGRVRKEAEVEGGGWVSTGDVVLAWFLKAALSAEAAASTQFLASSSVINKRRLLDVPLYPHNATGIVPLPLVPISRLPSMSVATLALLHRGSLTAHRTLPALASVSAFMRSLSSPGSGASLAFARPSDCVSFICSNQSAAGFSKMDFGGKLGRVREVVVLQSPFTPDHAVQINEVGGRGFMIGGSLRRSRWEAVDREMRRLEEDLGER